MKIAVDVCMSEAGTFLLRQAGHEVLTAEHGERDCVWLERARKFGAELLIGIDADIEIYAYDHRIPFLKQRRGESGTALAYRGIKYARKLVKTKPSKNSSSLVP